ncbi:MAG: photosystem II assembly protein Psb35 [Leptolyngbyaceae cyanobacterium]
MDVFQNYLLMQTGAESAPYFSAITIVFGVGFIAAVVIGSIAWYNSKRPVGWEDKERPDVVPDIKK